MRVAKWPDTALIIQFLTNSLLLIMIKDVWTLPVLL